MVSRDAVLTWIKRGVIALLLAITLYLSISAELSVWLTIGWLLLISLVIGAVILEVREKRKMRKRIEELEEEVRIPRLYEELYKNEIFEKQEETGGK